MPKLTISREFQRDKGTDNCQRLMAKRGDDGQPFGSIYVPYKAYPQGAVAAKVTLEFVFEEGE